MGRGKRNGKRNEEEGEEERGGMGIGMRMDGKGNEEELEEDDKNEEARVVLSCFLCPSLAPSRLPPRHRKSGICE